MKTKVLLGVLALLSISFIGLARPGSSTGSHAEAVFSEIATVTAPLDSLEAPIVSQDQDKQEQKKEVKKEVKKEEEDKKKEKTTVVWTGKLGKKGTYEIILDKDDPKKIIYVSPHVELDKAKPVMWTIKADKLHLSGKMKAIELDEGTVIYLNKDDKDGIKVVKLDSPHVQIKKGGKDAEHVAVEVHPKVHVVVDTDKYAKLIEKIKEKLAKLKVKDLDSEVKEVELEGIEKVLEELQKALENKYEKSEHVAVSVKHKDSHSYRIKTKDIHIDGEKLHRAVEITDDKGAFSLIYHAEFDIDLKESYEKAIKKLEGNLPEGCDVESTFDEDAGTVLIKITSDKESVLSKDEIKKLIEEFKEDLEKIKK